MATLTLSITSVADGTLSKTFTVTEAQMATWFAALKAQPFPPGNASLTNPQAALAWANNVWQQQVALVLAYQQAQLAAGAAPIASTT